MSVRETLMVGICIGSVLGAVFAQALAPYMGEHISAPERTQRLGKDRTQVVVEAEFTMHHQDCVLFSVWTQPMDTNTWAKQLTTYECGRGLIPSNPLPPDGGTDEDWDWEEYGSNAEASPQPNGS